ncbi:MAG: arginyltransferase [Vicinamibacterales bacterium]
MARLVQRFSEPPHECPYLPDRSASLDVRILIDVTPAELGHLLERGWRRFGPTYFRPSCATCAECVSLRIPVAAYEPSRSQRRARRQAAGLVRRVAPPAVDDERLALYARWHAQREARRGWEPSALDADRYAQDFAFPHPSVREVSFRDPAHGDRLVGLGIVDEVPGALSAAYFFWDPAAAPPSLGTAHILLLVEEAAQRGLLYVYLGYRVEGCASLAYKARFRPHELLDGRPGDRAATIWRPAGGTGEGRAPASGS